MFSFISFGTYINVLSLFFFLAGTVLWTLWRRNGHKVSRGECFFVCVVWERLLTFLLLFFFCRNSSLDSLETKWTEGMWWSVFFRLFRLGTYTNVLSLFFCRNRDFLDEGVCVLLFIHLSDKIVWEWSQFSTNNIYF